MYDLRNYADFYMLTKTNILFKVYSYETHIFIATTS